MRTLLEVLRADFLERSRGASFLALIGITIYLTYLFVPPAEADYLTVALGNRRGVYNAAWVGTMFGLAAATLLSLIAFYVVKNTINHDRKRGVGLLFAATPGRTSVYLLGKWLSNLGVLSVLLGVLTVMGLVMQQVRGEAANIDVIALSTPIWLMGLPVMAVVAGAAILFECVSFLRGGAGNVVYFFVWTAVLSASVLAGFEEGTVMQPGNDLFGLQVPVSALQRHVLALDPNYGGDFSIGASGFEEEVQLFTWDGANWPLAIVLGRLAWIGLGAILALVGGLPFDRFDPARRRPEDDRGADALRKRLASRLTRPLRRSWSGLTGTARTLTRPLARLMEAHPFGGAFLAEIRLALRGQPWWWALGLITLIFLGLTSPVESARSEILPYAWIWPILIWSQLGARESKHFTEALVFSAPRPLRRQLPATWLAGLAISLAAGSGVLVRLLVSGSVSALSAALVGAAFIPALSFALGVWSGTSRLFELVYLVWWYMLVNGAPPLDFMGTHPEAIARGMPLVYAGLTAALLLVGYLGRVRQINRL